MRDIIENKPPHFTTFVARSRNSRRHSTTQRRSQRKPETNLFIYDQSAIFVPNLRGGSAMAPYATGFCKKWRRSSRLLQQGIQNSQFLELAI